MITASFRRVRVLAGLLTMTAVIIGYAADEPPHKAQGTGILLEAEQFNSIGGWSLDQQFMDQMGSPYLLAHGLGVPVKDAVTTVAFPALSTYRAWVRTMDWVAPWKAEGAPGRFQVLVNGTPLKETFGTEGAQWHWQDGGLVTVSGSVAVALHDPTGFEGRCDAVFFSSALDAPPPNQPTDLAKFRRAMLGLPEKPEDGGSYDLVVVGGGIAGASAALSAARNGLTVALVQDRPVLGGNSSTEVRVWPEGKTQQKPYAHIGDIVEEIAPKKTSDSGNAKEDAVYADGRKLDAVRAEPRITLLLDQHVNVVDVRDDRIVAVVAQHIQTARRVRLCGKLFADCTGDGEVGFLAGADHELSTNDHMGASNMWNVKEGDTNAPFPRCPWALNLADKPFPGRRNAKGQWANTPLSNLGGWFWESGYYSDPINETERIRDNNFRAMYGAWDVLKNVDMLYPNHRINWCAYIAGKRESRRLLGDVVLTGDDFRTRREFPDGCYPCSWSIDIHTPHPDYNKGFDGTEFISKATSGRYGGVYWAPYRCLYSRNITNLFMAGRDISVDQEAIGPTRVMKTCGMMGEIVGKAAWICVLSNASPRDVYVKHLALLKELMNQSGTKRRQSIDDYP